LGNKITTVRANLHTHVHAQARAHAHAHQISLQITRKLIGHMMRRRVSNDVMLLDHIRLKN